MASAPAFTVQPLAPPTTRSIKGSCGTVGNDEDLEGGALECMALGDAINLLLRRAGVCVDENGNWDDELPFQFTEHIPDTRKKPIVDFGYC
jgi:hypothetical protein